MPDHPPLFESVSASYRELSAAAATLNDVSNELGKAVSDIDESLKKLNLGVVAWVQVHIDGPSHPQNSRYSIDEIGYAKKNGKWLITLRTRSGDEQFPDEEEDVEVWPFNEAPRGLRLQAIDKLPELLKALSAEATKTAQALQSKLANAKAVATAIAPSKASGGLQPRRSIAARAPLQTIEQSGMLSAAEEPGDIIARHSRALDEAVKRMSSSFAASLVEGK